AFRVLVPGVLVLRVLVPGVLVLRVLVPGVLVLRVLVLRVLVLRVLVLGVLLVAVLAAAGAGRARAEGQAPAINELLARIGERVAAYYKRAQNIVCIEKSV